MGKESIILGSVIILGGVWLYAATRQIWPSIIIAILGAALIIFNKEESKIERRKDKK